MFQNNNIVKLTSHESNGLECYLTITELTSALKHMKHDTTPGIDVLPAKFFKVFGQN